MKEPAQGMIDVTKAISMCPDRASRDKVSFII